MLGPAGQTSIKPQCEQMAEHCSFDTRGAAIHERKGVFDGLARGYSYYYCTTTTTTTTTSSTSSSSSSSATDYCDYLNLATVATAR